MKIKFLIGAFAAIVVSFLLSAPLVALVVQADLSITKTVSDATPNVGDFITFTVTLTNNGPASATNVTVNDLLPAGLSFVSAAPSQGTYDPATGIWNVGTVVVGAQTLTLTASVNSPAARINTATIGASDQLDPNSANNSASATETPQQADLALTKTVNNATPNVGDSITFTVTLTNTGPNPATGVTVNDLLPAGLSFVSAASSQGAYNPVTGIWNVGTVVVGTQTLTLMASVNSPAAQTNTATVGHSDQFDPNTANNSASTTTTTTPVFSVNSLGDQPDATPGDGSALTSGGLCTLRAAIQESNALSGSPVTVNFSVNGTITLGSNLPNITKSIIINGNGPANTIVSGNNLFRSLSVIETDGISVTYQNLQATNGFVAGSGFGGALDMDSAGGTLTLNNVILQNGVAGYGGGINADDGTLFINNSIIRDNTGNTVNGGIWSGNSVTVTLVNCLLHGNGGQGGALFSNGGVLNLYHCTVVNNLALSVAYAAGVDSNGGTLTIRNSIIADNLGGSADCDSGNTTSIQNTLIKGGDCGITNGVNGNLTGAPALNVDFTLSSASIAINTGDNSQISPGVTTDLAGNTRIQQVTVDMGAYESAFTPPADLSITKTDNQTSAVPGTPVTYTIVVSNNGPSAVTGASVSDPLPAGVTSATWTATTSSGGGTVTGPSSGTGALATTVNLPMGGTVTITFTVQIDPSATGSLVNTATVSPPAGVTDPNNANNSFTDTDTLTPQSDLSITKTNNTTSVVAGTNTTYTVGVTNNGPSSVTGATVRDFVPLVVTFVSATNGATYNAGPNTVDFTTGTLAPGGTSSFQLTVAVISSATGSLSNTASVEAPDVTDPTPGNNSATDTDTIGTSQPTIPVAPATVTTRNLQNGLSELVVTVQNTTGSNINGFRLFVDYNAYLGGFPTLKLYNATSPSNVSPPYIDYPFPMTGNQSVSLTLQFYTVNRVMPNPFVPVLTLQSLPASVVTHGIDTDTGIPVTNIVHRVDGSILLEFNTVAGNWYRVSYSPDMSPNSWYYSPVPIKAGSNKTQWIDNGPPGTDSFPVSSRFYRVSQIAAP